MQFLIPSLAHSVSDRCRLMLWRHIASQCTERKDHADLATMRRACCRPTALGAHPVAAPQELMGMRGQAIVLAEAELDASKAFKVHTWRFRR